MQTGHSLYALAWSPDSESVVVGAGRDLAIKGVQVSHFLYRSGHRVVIAAGAAPEAQALAE